jgi:hypothetical protein
MPLVAGGHSHIKLAHHGTSTVNNWHAPMAVKCHQMKVIYFIHWAADVILKWTLQK